MNRFFVVAWSVLFFIVGCAAQKPVAPPERATVLWLSIDGLRYDYLAQANAPTLQKLAREGASTNELHPVFPTLTFPNHISQATGVYVDRHGVVGNEFFDPDLNEHFKFPANGLLLRAEPIWQTAKRQGVRVAVLDWPMSQAQKGDRASDYFNATYESKQSDEKRWDKLAEIYENDSGESPLRLLMSYAAKVDSVGHKAGPASRETLAELHHVDKLLGQLLQRIVARFDAIKTPGDVLYVVITTDHGMEPVKSLVNLNLLIGPELSNEATIVTGGSIASIHLHQLPADRQSAVATAMIDKLKSYDCVTVAPARSDYLTSRHYGDKSREGVMTVILSPGYTFNREAKQAIEPAEGARGMHGYDLAACPNMRGSAIVWRSDRAMANHDLGPVENAQWHATVAKLLGILPAANSEPAIRVEGK